MAEAKKGDKDAKAPIIKKVKKVSGGGHHGGAWKVAYADFVTAMMAFFLLLWLLSTSSKATLDGIAEYFTPTIGITGAQGIGFKGGASAQASGTAQSNMSDPGVVTGSTPSGSVSRAPEAQAPTEGQEEDNLFKQGGAQIQQAFSQDSELTQYRENISIEQTPEGLKIDVMDSDKYGMFEPGSAKLTEHGQKILGKMAGLVGRMPNYVSITGHTDGSPIEAGNRDYTAWELSADRANAARRYLLQAGMVAERPKKITGMGDKELLLPSEPRNPRNRRISIIMLRGSHILIPDGMEHNPNEFVSAPKDDAGR